MLLRLEADEICASSVSDLADSRSMRPANCAAESWLASPVMSIPLPAPSALMMLEVADVLLVVVELVVVMDLRTADRACA
ncbi:hypothetical protein GCM10010990_12100 [Croceicoccus mobilis]|uniref:Uncharacterized protein n=1 Tax=Croceicoccus mobilis TaxID=1703339 RepID=A0A917DT40_9SPHN|nr:hypothetical protein GCM10010990_12100 [Croceicoccus mobilis]